MNSKPKNSCIIPFWNEGQNIYEVINEITKVKNISEIICVDDASVDSNHRIIPFKYPGIKIIRLEKNIGKSGAVRKGLDYASGENILLLDADLRKLDSREIEKAVEVFSSAEDLDMLILRRVNAAFYIRMYRADVLFTGERILRKEDLAGVFSSSDITGWQLESAINNWMLENKKNVAWIAHSAVNRQKYSKWGIAKGFRLDMKTFSDMVTAAGFGNMFKQILYFAKKEVRYENSVKKDIHRQIAEEVFSTLY